MAWALPVRVPDRRGVGRARSFDVQSACRGLHRPPRPGQPPPARLPAGLPLLPAAPPPRETAGRTARTRPPRRKRSWRPRPGSRSAGRSRRGRLAAATGRHPAALREALEATPRSRRREPPAEAPDATAPPAAANAPICDAPSAPRPADTAGSNCPGDPGKEHAVLVFPTLPPDGAPPRSRAAPRATGPDRLPGETLHEVRRDHPPHPHEPPRPGRLLPAMPRPGLPPAPAEPRPTPRRPQRPHRPDMRLPMQPASAARRWCSHACRQAAYRARKLGELPATALSRQNQAT